MGIESLALGQTVNWRHKLNRMKSLWRNRFGYGSMRHIFIKKESLPCHPRDSLYRTNGEAGTLSFTVLYLKKRRYFVAAQDGLCVSDEVVWVM